VATTRQEGEFMPQHDHPLKRPEADPIGGPTSFFLEQTL
jgi:hypothetical protein